MELEDSYGVTVSREETARITTVGDAVDFVFERLPGLTWRAASAGSVGGAGAGALRPAAGPEPLRELLDALPLTLRRQALTHSSWVEHRADSYGRLAFLGDSVLGLALAEHLFSRYPARRHRAADEDARPGGQRPRLRRGRGRARGPRAARRGGAGELEGGIEVEALLASERALASVCEAVIGACYLHHGFEVTASATVAAFASEIEIASERLLDFKSALQERLARAGARVRYEVTGESGPAARPRLRGRRERQRRGRRPGLGPLEEGGRAGGRRAGAGGASS